jgi:hypothetical protein
VEESLTRLLLRLEESSLPKLLLLHDNGVHNAADGLAPRLLRDLHQQLATLLFHHLAAALL